MDEENKQIWVVCGEKPRVRPEAPSAKHAACPPQPAPAPLLEGF